MGSFLGSLAEAARAFRAVFGNPDLRRVELAFIGFNTAELGTWVAVPEARLALLRSLPIFAPLSAPVLEQVASRLIPTEAALGSEIIRQGDPGDRFYVIEEGEVVVSKNGRQVATLQQGNFFGEIALLREIPRTATVTAQTDTLLYALERDDFLEAVTGHPQSAEAADAVTRARLADR
jgi:CRP-like cAMP-binding protein